MFVIKRVGIFDVIGLYRITYILNECGKEMAKRYSLNHWKNPFLKSAVIVLICALRNDMYLVTEGNKYIATFQTNIIDKTIFFEKLGTLPTEEGRGIGSFCLRSIEEIGKKNNCMQATMDVYELSKHAITFYEHNGYHVSGKKQTKKYIELIMEKAL